MSNAGKRRIVVAITGATGAIYGVRLLQELRRQGGIETHLVVSKAGFLSAATELDVGRSELEAYGDVVHADRDIIRQIGPELPQHGARLAHHAAAIGAALVPIGR